MDTNYSLADIAAATGGNRNNDGFGDGNGWWIILFLLICGWGGYGFGVYLYNAVRHGLHNFRRGAVNGGIFRHIGNYRVFIAAALRSSRLAFRLRASGKGTRRRNRNAQRTRRK